MYFQFYPLHFYDFWHILISYWVHFFHIIFYFMLYVCIFCTNQLQYITLVHIQWCTVYVIYIRYTYLRYIHYHKFLLCHTLYKLLILSSQKPYSSAPVIYVMKWVNMTYVLSDCVCFWQFAYLVTINFQEFSIIYFIIKFVHNHLFADSLKITFLCGTDGCFCYDIM